MSHTIGLIMSNIKFIWYSWVIVYQQLTNTYTPSTEYMAKMGDKFLIFGSSMLVVIQILLLIIVFLMI